ncbi:MAG: cytochrome c peroxidase [Verrucomicrobiota bacterium]
MLLNRIAVRCVKFAFVLSLGLALMNLGTAQTNSLAPTNPAPVQVWDYADELFLTETQQKRLFEIRDRLEAARAEVRRTSVSNTPPDARLAAQLYLNDQTRLVNRGVGEVLTEAQKTKLAELRRAARNVRLAAGRQLVPAQTNRVATVSADDDEPPTLAPSRKPPRKSLSNEEYRQLAVELRGTYSQPAANWPAPNIDAEIKPLYREIGLLPLVVFPTNNPYSDAKAGLGKKLFFEPRLSGSGQISCANCHDPDLAFADGRTVSFGHERKELKRNSPTLLNTAFNEALFWDGRAASLEQQASDVVNNQDEMHSSAQFVREKLGVIPGYTNEFATVFGSPEVTLARVAQAIATFERTITSRGNQFDSFLRGETNALSDEAVRGLHLFRTDARCVNCHNGPNFTDGRFHNEGLTYYSRKYEDLGRYSISKDPQDVGRFKTPTLRNIARTAPYMHNGLFDFDGVLNMYNAGMPTVRPNEKQKHDPLFPVKSPHLQPLGLNAQDLADLKAFLESLTETRLRVRPPELPKGKEG